MTKKAQRRSSAKSNRRRLPSAWWAAAGLAFAVALTVWAVDLNFDGAESGGKSFQVKGGETRPVLDPFQFSARRAALAYAAARKYPGVMDQLFCYCYCNRPPFNHKSLLSCFTDRHGAS